MFYHSAIPLKDFVLTVPRVFPLIPSAEVGPRHQVPISVLDHPIPFAQGLARAPQPGPQLVQQEPGVIAAEKLPDHFLGLSGAALHVHGLQNRDDILEQVLCFTGSASADGVVVLWPFAVVLYVEKFEDTQLVT